MVVYVHRKIAAVDPIASQHVAGGIIAERPKPPAQKRGEGFGAVKHVLCAKWCLHEQFRLDDHRGCARVCADDLLRQSSLTEQRYGLGTHRRAHRLPEKPIDDRIGLGLQHGLELLRA